MYACSGGRRFSAAEPPSTVVVVPTTAAISCWIASFPSLLCSRLDLFPGGRPILVRQLSVSPWLRSTTRLDGDDGVHLLRRRSGIDSNGCASRCTSGARFSSESCHERGTLTGVTRGTWLTGFASRTAGGRRMQRWGWAVPVEESLPLLVAVAVLTR